MTERLVTIATFPGVTEADLARIYLEGEGVRAFVADAEIVSMDWLLGNAVGYVKLQVAESEAERARGLLAQRPPVDAPVRGEADERLSEPLACLQCGREMPEYTSVCPHCGWSYAEGGESPEDGRGMSE